MDVFQTVWLGLKEVYSKISYITVGLLFGATIFSLNLFLGDYSSLNIGFSIHNIVGTIFLALEIINIKALVLLMVVSLLSGLVFGLMIYIIRRQIKTSKAAGISGILVSVVTPACPACAVGFLGFLGLGGVLTSLPFHGKEFGILGVVLLLFSTWYLSKKVTTTVCEVK